MDGPESTPYHWLTKGDIAHIEKQLNPASLPFPPPKSWSCPEIGAALREAYKTKFPGAKCEPDYERAKSYITKELNHIMEKRIALGPVMGTLETWKKEKFPGNEPFSSVALVAASCAPPTATREHQSSPEATLPLQSQCTPSSSRTSVSTGRGTVTLNGNGGSHKSENPGSSPGRPRSRRGRGGNRSSQSRPGNHLCPFNGCGKTFQYPSKLKDHEHTHRQAKTFSCNVGPCTKSFKRMRELKAHKKTHPGHIPEDESVDHEMVDSRPEVEHGEDPGPATDHQGEGMEVDQERTSPMPLDEDKNLGERPSSPTTPNGPGTPSAPASPDSERYPQPTERGQSPSMPVISSGTSTPELKPMTPRHDPPSGDKSLKDTMNEEDVEKHILKLAAGISTYIKQALDGRS